MPSAILTRRRLLRTALAGLVGLSTRPAEAAPQPCRGDVALDAETALLFPAQAPLTPAPGLRDARAVWARVPARSDPSVLLFLHGYNNHVGMDVGGRSRVPDWANTDPAARAAASARPAAPLAYGLDRLAAVHGGKRPLLLVPEDATLSQGSFWAKTPRGQYRDPAQLGALVAAARAHLACLRRPDGLPYLPLRSTDAAMGRVFLCGHSGAGLPLQEAAGSDLVLPRAGLPTDLWLFDCTYWGDVASFAGFCALWHEAGRLAAGRRDAARFVCVYRPRTQTEVIADVLRAEVAKLLGVPASGLVLDHVKSDVGDNFAALVRPTLLTGGALFVRTSLPHDDIPTYFVPRLLETAA